jgi:penicillin-binding protein 2
MERITRFRVRIILLLFVLVLGFFAIRLYDMQIIETGGSKDNTTTFTTLTRVKAARGDILDRNGNVLVRNRASYDLVINHYVIKSASGTNDHLYELAKRCQEQGIEYIDHFPVTKERPFTYTLSEQNSTWQSYFQVFLTAKGGLDSDITAPLLIQKLRQKYNLPEEWTDEEARMVIGLRYELDLRGPVQSLPQYVFKTDVNDEDLSAIMELNIPGMNVEPSTVREYNTEYAAHILGYVGPMSPDQYEQYKNNPDYSMDSEIGQDGIEAAYEEYLHGVDGWRIDEVRADGTVVESYYLDGKEPRAGSNVEISIDINLQQVGEDSLARVLEGMRAQEDGEDATAEGGAIVAMDVKTGEVLICGSYPTYNLSTYSEDFNDLLQQPFSPMFNRALLGTYPPGSTYKMTMVIAGIDSGIIDSNWKVDAVGKYDKYPDFEVFCYYYTGTGKVHGEVDAANALKVSCNYFFYELGDRIQLSAMDATAKAMGLGEPTGVELFEYTGRRANKETKKKLYPEGQDGWYPADQITAAIGQSDNRFTPMQLCAYATTLANRGTRLKATFLNRVVSSDYRQLLERSEVSVLSHLDISDDAYNAYMEGMQLVSHDEDGSVYGVFGEYPIRVASKTGTAQTSDPYGADHGAFICFAPANDPQIAIAVYGEKANGGSKLAIVARDIMDIYFEVGEIGDVNIYENTMS